jgi:putative transposase
MSKSASGTQASPGKKVAAKSGLNKAILDQGWFEFRRQLEYKLNWQGVLLLAVPVHYTSQTCPECGHVAKENRQTQTKFLCVACSYGNNADRVGALNILERGLRLLACGEVGSVSCSNTAKQPDSVKQEPTEVTRQGAILV